MQVSFFRKPSLCHKVGLRVIKCLKGQAQLTLVQSSIAQLTLVHGGGLHKCELSGGGLQKCELCGGRLHTCELSGGGSHRLLNTFSNLFIVAVHYALFIVAVHYTSTHAMYC